VEGDRRALVIGSGYAGVKHAEALAANDRHVGLASRMSVA